MALFRKNKKLFLTQYIFLRFLFILKTRVSEIEREREQVEIVIYSLARSLDSLIGQCWGRLKPETNSFFQVSHMDDRDSDTWANFLGFSQSISQSKVGQMRYEPVPM